MSSSAAEVVALARHVSVTEEELEVVLADGRRLTVPLDWFPRLKKASPKARANWELLGDGEGIHWEEADEDLSVAGLLAGFRERSVQSRQISDLSNQTGPSMNRVVRGEPVRAHEFGNVAHDLFHFHSAPEERSAQVVPIMHKT